MSAEEVAAEKQRILGLSAATGTASVDRDIPKEVLPPSDTSDSPMQTNWVRRHALVLWIAGGLVASAGLAAALVYPVWSNHPNVAADDNRATAASKGGMRSGGSGTDLSALLEGTPGNCSFGGRLLSLVGDAPHQGTSDVGQTTRAISIPGLPTPLTARAFRASGPDLPHDAYVVDLPARGVWQGLQVTRLRVVRWGADVASVQVHFSNPPEDARSSLNSLGFQLPSTGQLRNFEAGANQGAIGIETRTSGAALTCAVGRSVNPAPEPVANAASETD